MRELSRRSGVSVQTVSLFAMGEVDISVGRLKAICRALDCTVIEFFGPLPGRERAA